MEIKSLFKVLHGFPQVPILPAGAGGPWAKTGVRLLARARRNKIQEPGTAVPGTPIFANNAQRGGPPLESPCRVLSLVLSFASKESTALLGAAAPPFAP